MNEKHEPFSFFGYGLPSEQVGPDRLHVKMRDLGVLEALVKRARQDVFSVQSTAQIWPGWDFC